MHQLRMSLTVVITLLGTSVFNHGTGVMASPLEKRAASSSFSSVSTSSSIGSTSSPSAAASSSVAAKSTISASTAASTSSPASASTSTSSGIASPSNAPKLPAGVPVCKDPVDEGHPFCAPKNGSDVWVGDTYTLTWSPPAFSLNSTLIILLTYDNTTSPSAGSEAWKSDETPSSYGFVSVTMDAAWLKDKGRNNLTFVAGEVQPKLGHGISWRTGPAVSLINKPVDHYPPPPPTPPPTRLGLIIGIPLALFAIALILGGLFFGMRKQRRIGLGSVMGRGRKGYGIGKSRRQRVGAGARGIRLDDDITSPGGHGLAGENEGGFRDEPLSGGAATHAREESLGSLAASPDEDGSRDYRDDHKGNAFRDEVARQRTGERL